MMESDIKTTGNWRGAIELVCITESHEEIRMCGAMHLW